MKGPAAALPRRRADDPNQTMKDLTSVFWIKVKGSLFLLIGLGGALLLFLDNPKWQTAIVLGLTIWGWCRFYYFAFYVIEKYVDPGYRFSGLISFARHLTKPGKTGRK
jgi:hypothetical protein